MDGGALFVKRPALRPWVRAAHRDLGYLAVGLTLVYALSGLAVNHIADWDPSFRSYERTVQTGGPIAGDDEQIAKVALDRLGIADRPRSIDRVADDRLELSFDARTVHVDPTTGAVHEEGQTARPLLRLANWLHLNRGKKAWTYFADAYAAGLLFLALSGLFMIPGRKGLLGRGAVLVAVGVAVPVAYVALSGGPEAPRATR
ncbi:MAG: PepSY-associated TM helix domain-containing protein [Polyangiaceae bacterium]|nr:PepSY-associated TM helix domain-containing protein [Polyangiaceae bacterium]